MESTAATTASSPWWRCLKPAQSAWSSLMVYVKHNVTVYDCTLLLHVIYSQLCGLRPLKAPLGTRCHRRSTRTCLSPRMEATAGGGHCGVLTTTAYWTRVASLWLWRLSEKDKSRPSSMTMINQLWAGLEGCYSSMPDGIPGTFFRGEGDWMNHP